MNGSDIISRLLDGPDLLDEIPHHDKILTNPLQDIFT